MISSPDPVQRGLHYLESLQRKDGGFWSETPVGSRIRKRHSIFPTILILQALEPLRDDTLARTIAFRALEYLRRNRSSQGGYNYWERESNEAQTHPYPDDLDDTACAYQAETAWSDTPLDAKAAGMLTNLLINAEIAPGGPYATWINPPDDRWKDCDSAVNANIAFMLQALHISMPTLDHVLKGYLDAIPESPYYAGPLPPLYFLARYARGCDTWSGEQRSRLASQILRKTRDAGLTRRAMAASARLSLGFRESFEATVEQALLSAQNPDGSWSFEPLIIEHSPSAQAGAAALSTAMAIEALTLMKKQDRTNISVGQKAGTTRSSASEQSIVQRVRHWNEKLPVTLQENGKDYLSKILASSHFSEIGLLPSIWQQNLREKSSISQEIVEALGMANVLGWTAYTILDDAYDESKTAALPYALACSREIDRIYTTLLPASDLGPLYRRVMDSLDSSNAWEHRYATAAVTSATEGHILSLSLSTLPTWRTLYPLASRSFGHALGPLAELLALGHGEDSSAFKATYRFFEHALIARQLDDDLHDWEEDLLAGRLTYPVTMLLRDSLDNSTSTLNLNGANLQRLRIRYHERILPKGCKSLLSHCGKARAALVLLDSVLTDTSSFDALMLQPHEQAASMALEGQINVQYFLEGLYHPNGS